MNDCFQQVALGAHLADFGQVRTDVPSQIADGVTGGAGCFLAVENTLPAPDVSVLEVAEEFIEVRFLFGGIDIERRQQKAHLDELLSNLKDGDIRRGQSIFNSQKAA